jgi:hypothetical protein
MQACGIIRYRKGVDDFNTHPLIHRLSIKVFNPTDGFKVCDFAKVPLCGRQVRIQEAQLDDNFNRCAGLGCIFSFIQKLNDI